MDVGNEHVVPLYHGRISNCSCARFDLARAQSETHWRSEELFQTIWRVSCRGRRVRVDGKICILVFGFCLCDDAVGIIHGFLPLVVGATYVQ